MEGWEGGTWWGTVTCVWHDLANVSAQQPGCLHGVWGKRDIRMGVGVS